MSKPYIKNNKGVPPKAGPKVTFCPDEMTLAACLEGTLGKDELVQLHLHLESCETCRENFAAMQDNYAKLGDSSGVELPEVSRLSEMAKKLKPR